MKTQHWFFLASCVLFCSCSAKHSKTENAESNSPVIEQPKVKEQLKKGEVIPSVICANNALQSYAVYLPKDYSDSLKFPVIIFFDPHGSGSYPVGLYKSLAEWFGYILMGSNNAKNGLQFEETNAIVGNLIVEAAARFSVDAKRISLAGFSGGAKVALMGASIHPELLSVIFCGAAIPFENVQQLPSTLGFAGERDMNYTEVMSSDQVLNEKKIMHEIVQWNGKHEWPDSVSFADAFYWCSFTTMRNQIMPIDNSLVKSFVTAKNKLLSSKRNVLYQVTINHQLASFLYGIADISMFEKKMDLLERSDAYRKEIQKLQNTLGMESKLKENYMKYFESKNLNWWREEVSRMRRMKTGDEAMMYQRLLSYLSLASYSYSNNAIKQNNFPAAQQFLAIYRIVDPEISDRAFLEACMYARQGDQQKAVVALEEAVQLGLKDKSKIENEESFSSLRSNQEFNKLIKGL